MKCEKLQDVMLENFRKSYPKIKKVKIKGPYVNVPDPIEINLRGFPEPYQPDLEFELENGEKAIGEWFLFNSNLCFCEENYIWPQFDKYARENNIEFWILTKPELFDVLKNKLEQININPNIFAIPYQGIA